MGPTPDNEMEIKNAMKSAGKNQPARGDAVHSDKILAGMHTSRKTKRRLKGELSWTSHLRRTSPPELGLAAEAGEAAWHQARLHRDARC